MYYNIYIYIHYIYIYIYMQAGGAKELRKRCEGVAKELRRPCEIDARQSWRHAERGAQCPVDKPHGFDLSIITQVSSPGYHRSV